jgi:uncharacterized protein
MNEINPYQLLIEVFFNLHKGGLKLGIGELLAVLRASSDEFRMILHQVSPGHSSLVDDLRRIATLLWCRSPEDEYALDEIWASVLGESRAVTKAPTLDRALPQEQHRETLPEHAPDWPSRSDPTPEPAVPTHIEWAIPAVPARYQPPPPDDTVDLHTYWPVSRRQMAYSWRYLRSPVRDGPADVLDLSATVEQAARQGFLLAPIYRRRERNAAHLVLLIDQGGSMTPFHRFTQDLLETARDEANAIERVEIFYFHNVPTASVYHDRFVTEAIPLDEALAEVSSDTSIMIVSDGGAARGYRSEERIRTTVDCLARLKQRTSLLAWLNPMPQGRWAGTSAQVIAYLVPMFQMDPDGLSTAIDVARGQSLTYQ